MKINNIFITSLTLLCLSGGTSCKKYLDLKPLDGIVQQEFWKTREDLTAAVFGCYSSLVGSPPDVTDRPVPLSIFLWGENRADMVVPTDASTTQEQRDIKDIVNVNIIPTNTLVTWSNLYRTINYCNNVVDRAPDVKANDPTLTDTQSKALVGEALAIRSLLYFYLIRTFRDVPLKLTGVSKDSDIIDIGKSSQQQVLDRIISDLKIAQEGVPETYGTTAKVNKGRITKMAVTTLLADVYLWAENYSACVTECNKVLAYAAAHPAELALIPASSSWYSTVFETGSSTETIFELAYNLSNANPFGAFLVNGSTRRLIASPYLLEIFEQDPNDINNDRPDIRAESYFNTGSMNILKLGNQNTSYSNFQVYRLSDVMLIKAEALAFTGGGAEALKIISDLRLARRAVITTQMDPDPSSPDGVAEYVLVERAREFAFEGKRWFDLLRYAKRNNYANISLFNDLVSKTVLASAQQSAIAKYQDKDSHYLPINQADIFADLKLIQNPFYNR